MGYRTIYLSDEAYEILKNAKKENEIFSQVVIRLARRGSYEDFVGCISKESGEKLSETIGTFWKERGKAWAESMELMMKE